MPVRPRSREKKFPTLLDFDALAAYAGRILSARAQTVSELREKLRRRAERKEDVDRVIAHLKELGYINDQRFARSFAEWRRENEGMGKMRVVRDLLARRVAPAVAKQAADAVYSGADEVAMIESFLNRKYRGKDLNQLLARENADHEKNLASAYRKLRAAGFSSGNSIRVLKRYAGEADRLEGLEEREDLEST